MGSRLRKVGHILLDLYRLLIAIHLGGSRYYYQYREDRLSACPTVIHGLLHVPRNIRDCGPGWTAWTFFIERFCGLLQSTLRSRSQPWGNLNNRLTQLARLNQLAAQYDLAEELDLVDRYEVTNRPTRYEQIFEDCEYLLHWSALY